MPQKSLLIIQNEVPHYRKPFFNALSNFYNVTVIHSGNNCASQDRFQTLKVPCRKFGCLHFQPDILRHIKNPSYAVVVAMFDCRWPMNLVALAAKRKDVRFLYWGHRYSHRVTINALRDYLIKHSSGTILYSSSEIPKMVARGIKKNAIYVAPNTIDIPDHANGAYQMKDSLLFVGRLQKRKNIEILIKAFSEILNAIPSSVNLIIIGDGQIKPSLMRLALDLGISKRVRFLGEILDHSLLINYFHAAFAYCSPGAVGLSVLHSFAYGTPVITHRLEKHGPEFDNLVHMHNSIIYNSYAELKFHLIDICCNPQTSRNLGNNAYIHYSQNRTLDRMVAGFINAIEGTPSNRAL